MKLSQIVWLSWCLLVTMFVLAGRPVWGGQEIQIVSPRDAQDVEGNSGGVGCSTGSYRSQQMFPISDFETLPEDHHLLTRLALRPDASTGRPTSVHWDDVKIQMATTPIGVWGLDSILDNNLGPEPTVVYGGPLTISTENTGPAAGPKDFDEIVTLQTPYWYDPSEGDLVIEWASESGSSQGCAWDGSTSSEGWSFAGGATKPTLDWALIGVVYQFTFTSEQPDVMLQAGDADQDLDVDQLDLVQVQIAGKYLTGQAATWGEGDWNGAPGGSPGAPPTGDGQFNQLDIVATQQAAVYLTGPYAALAPAGAGANNATIVYDNDLSAVGSLLGGGDLGVVDLKYVPEPSTLLLLGFGLVGLLVTARLNPDIPLFCGAWRR